MLAYMSTDSARIGDQSTDVESQRRRRSTRVSRLDSVYHPGLIVQLQRVQSLSVRGTNCEMMQESMQVCWCEQYDCKKSEHGAV